MRLNTCNTLRRATGRILTCVPCFRSNCCRPVAAPRTSLPVRAMATQPTSYSGLKTSFPPGLVKNTWGMEKQTQKFPSLQKDEGEVDVVVVGGGLAGMLIAYELSKNGKSVAIVESRVRASGQSGRTSAHIMQWHDDFYSELEQKYGKDVTKTVANSMIDAIDYLERVTKEEGIECKFSRVPGYLVPPHPTEAKVLGEELEACHRAGMTDVKKVDLSDQKKNGLFGEALLFPRSAEFQPIMFINGLADVLASKYKVKIFEGSRVLFKDMTLDGVVPAESGGRIKARDGVVLATNSPINHNVIIHSRQEPYRSYMIGMAIDKGAIERAHWWTAEEVYKYVRLDQHEGRDILLVGGRDHTTGQPDEGDPWADLEAYGRTHWPQAKEVVYRWSGQVYEPLDELGLYGLEPAEPANAADRVLSAGSGNPIKTVQAAVDAVTKEAPNKVKRYVATGDSGQGMTGSAIAAMVIGDLILNRPSAYAKVYDPARASSLIKPSSLATAGGAVENVGSGWGAVPALRGAQDVAGLVGVKPDLKPGEGAVVQEGLRKVALYMDDNYVLHKRSATCTHLGCLVSWNPRASTFDCCCHGTQYTCMGQVINGPACVDLEDLGSENRAPESVKVGAKQDREDQA